MAIAPYEGMRATMLKVANNIEDIALTVEIGNLESGLKIVQDTSSSQYDIIISRGGTAEMIYKYTDVPVVEIPISVYDVLRAIKLADNFGTKYAIVGYPSITKCAHLLCEVLQYDIDIFTLSDETDVNAQLVLLKNQGYGVILSDVIGYVVAKQLGFPAILITSGEESIEEAFYNAIRLNDTIYNISYKNKLFEALLSENETHSLVFNQNRKLIYSTSNKMDTHIESMVFDLLPDFLETDTQVEEIKKEFNNSIVTIKKKNLYISKANYIIVYISINNSSLILEDKSISLINRSDDSEFEFTNNMSVYYVKETEHIIKEYSKTSFPVLIIGESGTVKDQTANIIYELGPYKNSPLYIIDCNLTSERRWYSLLNSENSPLIYLNITIYFKSIEKLSEKQSINLINMLESSDFLKYNRLIFSYNCCEDEKKENILYNYLKENPTCLTLILPPLRERKEDIPRMLTLYINQLNTELGKQVVGFDSEAIILLQNFNWENNINQFKRIVKELVITTTSSYITAEQVDKILKKEAPHQILPGYPNCAVINIKQSLSEMYYDIARIVLDDEGMNHGKTAERLGISRSTLWRILKNNS
ncbi:MAG: sigma-54-dependent Fis family transcriptional regulator [Gottschalkiaceae bacterium]|nr:MAG: sigma-54-dependent Fis family transcriptional regulator [Gottschalkiaceae bacterium]